MLKKLRSPLGCLLVSALLFLGTMGACHISRGEKSDIS